MASHRLHNREVIPTQRKRVEEALRKSEEQYRLLAEHVPDVIYIMDMDLRLTYVSPSVTRQLGYSVEEAMPFSLEELLTPSSLEVAMKAWAEELVIEDMEQKDLNRSRVLELELGCKDGSTVWTEMSISFLRDLDDKAVGILGVARDISDRKRAEEKLRESEERYHSIYKFARDGIITIDSRSRVISWNPAAEAIFGYSSDEVMDKPLTFIMPEQFREAFQKAIVMWDSTEESMPIEGIYEFPGLRKDGSTISTEVSVSKWKSKGGHYYTAVIRDITERKQAEEALREAHDMLELRVEERTAELVQEIEERKRVEERLRESEEKLSVMFESTSEGIAVTDLKGKILDVNDTILRMSGLSREELVGKEGFALMPREDAKGIIGQGKNALKRETGTAKMSQEITPTYGRSYDVDLSIGVLRDSAGDPTGFVAIARDITESKRAEEALRESEERYKALFNRSLYCVYVHDFEGNFIDANESALKLLGYMKEEITSVNFSSLLIEGQLPKAFKSLEEVKQTGFQKKPLEFKLRRKDGGYVWVETESTLIYQHGEPYAIQGIARDITERKQAEEALRGSEEKYRALVDHMEEGYMVFRGGRIRFANRRCAEVIGIPVEKLIGENYWRFLAPESQEQARQTYETLRGGGKVTPIQEYVYLTEDGQRIPVEVSMREITYEGKSSYAVVLRDIAERRRVEEALGKSEEHYRLLADNVTDVIWIVDMNLRPTYISPSVTHQLGYSVEEAMALRPEENLTPDSLEVAMEAFAEEMAKEKMEQKDLSRLRTLEMEQYCKDGSTIWTEMELTFLRDTDGQPVGILAVARDITQRRQAEEALRKSEEHYRLLAENVTDVIWTMDRNLQFTYISPSVTRQRGYSVEEAMALGMEKSLTPASLEVAAKVILEGLSEEKMGQKDLSKTWTVELEMYCKDGSTIWTEMEATFLRDPDGQAIGIQGVARDITERKRAEEALRHSEQHFRSLIENAQDGVVIVNSDITISDESPSMERMTGYKVKERIGKEPLDFCHPDDITEVAEAFLQLLENKIPIVHKEFRYRHKNGSWRTFEVVGNNLLDDPAVEGIVLNMRDITERKQAEEEIRRLNEGLEQRVIERTVQLQAVNKELEAFAYSVSHDLRAPLRSIDGFSQVLLEDYTDRLDDKGKNYLQRVRSASQRMAELIDDLINLSRLTRGEMRYETVDLSALAQTITMELQQSQPERDVEFIIAPGLVAKGDANLLRVALVNLLGNSWKFAKKQGRVRIEFGYAETNGQPAYFVRDNGVGFDMAYADKLFGAFQRLHSHNEFEGSGIGLATVQRIIHRHGGKIWAESTVDQGATFYFTL